MKAVVYEKFGSPDRLTVKDVPEPTPRDDEVLVRVHSASVNSWDWDLLRGRPMLTRMAGGGLIRPANRILGADIAGWIAEVGHGVTRFRPGDEVFGDNSGNWGGFAEFVCVPADKLVTKPPSMTFEQAAAIPQAGLLALQGLRDKRRVQPRDKVLINGGGGGVGTFAIQIAKRLGAEVTGVDHTVKLDTMNEVGADHVVDYTREDFTRLGESYDLILDVAARRSVLSYLRALNANGAYVLVGGRTGTILEVAVLGPLISLGRRKVTLLAWHPGAEDLDRMKVLFESRKVVPVIDRTYRLEQTADALRYLGKGYAKGKVVINVDRAE